MFFIGLWFPQETGVFFLKFYYFSYSAAELSEWLNLNGVQKQISAPKYFY